MAIEKLVPQYLNQDEDERLVKPFEMIDALNVRVANEDEGNQGILKNIDGTTAVVARSTADAIPADGTNRIIGAVSSDASKCVYYFLYNSLGNHGIYRYNISNENYQKLYEDSVLNFEYNGFVKADVVINQYQEDLLYFTDNRNEPRKINATRAGLNQYDAEFNNGSDYVKNLYLTACKRPPQEPITFGFVNDNNLLVNNLKESCFQFACQYVYDDGEVSAIGVYSSLAVSPTHLAYNTTTQTFFQNNNNAIDLTIPNSDGPVEKIKILARKNNAGAFYQIGEVANTNSDTQVFRWTNDGVYPLVPDTEANKMYDALPRQAGTQTITNNRLLYGNYVEGFDPIEPDTAMYPVYHLGGQEDISNFTGSLRDGAVEDRDDFMTKRYFGDIPARFANECTDGDSDGSSGVEEISPTYNNSAFIDQYPIEIDLSEAEESGQNSSFAYYFDLSIGEIAWFAVEGGSFTNSGDYVTRPVSVVDEDGNPETTSIYTAGLRLGFPAEVSDNLTLLTGSDSYKNNYNAGVRNLRPENNLIFSGTVDVDAWTSKADLGTQLVNGIVGQTATIAVSPNILNNSEGLAEGTFLAGSTTEARILNSDGSVPNLYGNCTDSLTNAYGVSSKLFLWMAGSVDLTIDYGYYTNQKVRFRLRRTGFNLSTVATKAVWNGTQSGGFVRAHPFIWNTRNSGEHDSTTALSFFGQNASGGSYDTVVWSGDTMLIDYSSNNNYNNAQYIGGDPVNGTDGSVLGGGYIRTMVRGLTADIRLSQDIRLDSASSFKAGARHDFGLVYFDSRNRPSPVYKLGSVNTSRFGDRGGNRNGRTEIDIKLFHEPPDYAAYWAPVYTKNTTYESFLQVTVAEAALPRKTSFVNVLSGNASGGTQRVISGLKTSIDETIFLSMRTLEGKNNSYKELKGGLIDYKYQEGDKLRVIQYQDGNTINRPYHEFVITGYNYYQDNDENPIRLFRDSVGSGDEEAEKDAYRRTGWFLSVRDDKVDGFSASDIAAQTDYFSQRCLIEIIRPKKNTDTPLYYEVGQQRPIVTTSEGVRTHGGDRSNTVAEGFYALPVSENTFWSTYRVYRGDRVVGSGLSSDGYVIVDSVLPQGFGYIYSVIGQVTVPQNPAAVLVNVSTGGGTQSILPGVITLSEGDVYLRLREQLTNPEGEYSVGVNTFSFDAGDPENQQYRNFLIESESVSDFFDSKATSIGRPHVEDTEQVQLTRSSSVTYSDPFALDSSRLSLSSFNPMFFPYKDYPTKYGQVTYLLDGGEVAYVMQEKRCGIQPISRTLIESSGDGQLVTSTNVMGTESYYAGMYGPGRNPESVVSRFGKTYFADVEAGRVIELSREGVQPISDNKMSSYFKRVFAAAIDTETSPRIPSGIDPDNDEYLVTILQLTTNNIVINDGADDEEVIGTVATPTSETLTYDDGVVTPVFEDSGITTWNKDQSRWEDATLNDITWGTKGLGTVVLDRLNERDGVHISFSERDSDANVTVDVVTSDLRFIGLATVSLSDWSIDIPSVIVEVGDAVEDDVDEDVVVEENASSALTTISYSTTKQFWLTRYSFTPELYANIHNRFLSFFNGQLYLHDSNDVRNNFYGTQYNSTATLVSKADPSMVKVYNALSLEGNDTWAATVSNSEQTTDITEAMYQEREGMYYSVIPNDATEDSVNNTSHKIVLGEVESITGQVFNIVKFTSRISNLPFGIGDSIYALQDDQDQTLGVTVTEIIDRKTIRVSGTLTGQVGNTLMAVSSNVINGDKLRDYYAQIQLTNDSTGRVELFAVNANYTPSPFHNDQSQKQ